MVLPELGEQTQVVDGVVCVVVHLSTDPNMRLSACTGQYFRLPDRNDTRPTTFCGACREVATRILDDKE